MSENAQSQALQDLFGITTLTKELKTMIGSPEFAATFRLAVSEGIKSVLADAATMQRLVEIVTLPEVSAVFKDAVVSGIKATLEDADARKTILESDEIKKFGVEVISEAIAASNPADAVCRGIQGVMADEEYFQLIVSVLGDSIYHFAQAALNDADLEAKFIASGRKLLTEDLTQGMVSEAVYTGFKRLTSDEDVLQSMAALGNMVMNTQAVTNKVAQLVTDMGNNHRAFLKSQEFKDGVIGAITAGIHEVFNLSFQEMVEEFKNLDFKISVG